MTQSKHFTFPKCRKTSFNWNLWLSVCKMSMGRTKMSWFWSVGFAAVKIMCADL
jgi:hypothetical protein